MGPKTPADLTAALIPIPDDLVPSRGDMSEAMPHPRTQLASVPTPVIGLREVMDAIPDLLFCLDGFGRFAWVSPGFETLTGHRASNLIGEPV